MIDMALLSALNELRRAIERHTEALRASHSPPVPGLGPGAVVTIAHRDVAAVYRVELVTQHGPWVQFLRPHWQEDTGAAPTGPLQFFGYSVSQITIVHPASPVDP